MVNLALMEQIEQLSTAELAELRDVIDAKLHESSDSDLWITLESRVAEVEANPDEYITFDEWRTNRVGKPTSR